MTKCYRSDPYYWFDPFELADECDYEIRRERWRHRDEMHHLRQSHIDEIAHLVRANEALIKALCDSKSSHPPRR
jgi:hypothetical protein